MGYQQSTNLDIFRSEFLNANTWTQRKDGIPLDLLDNLSVDELQIAESELINALSRCDSWPIRGLGYIKSSLALPYLYKLLPESNDAFRITLAHAIYSIYKDGEMIEETIKETTRMIKHLSKMEYQLIDVVYLLPDFKNEKITEILHNLCKCNNYLVAYNARRALGYSPNNMAD